MILMLIKRNEENGTESEGISELKCALLFSKNPILPTRSLIFKAHLGSWTC